MTPAARAVCGAVAGDRSSNKEDRHRDIVQKTGRWRRWSRGYPRPPKERLCPVATFPRNEPRKSRKIQALPTLVAHIFGKFGFFADPNRHPACALGAAHDPEFFPKHFSKITLQVFDRFLHGRWLFLSQ